MAKHKLIKHAPLNRTSGVCLKPDKRGKPTKPQPKQRTVTSKPNATPASVQFPLAGFDPSMEIAEERSAWSELARELAGDAKNFNPEASIKRLQLLSMLYDGARNTQRRRKYEILQHVYEQFELATISGKLPEVIEIYREEGMIIHSDVHPVLAVIRANIRTSRDCVSRWGLVLRYAHTKKIPPKKLIGFLKEHGIQRCCDEFRKLQTQAQLAADKDGGTRVETSVEENDAEKDRTRKAGERTRPVKSGKAAAGRADDQNQIETTTDFDESFMRITGKRENVFVQIDGYVSAEGRLTLKMIQPNDKHATTSKRRLKSK
jgi:hypothetical protein